MLTLGLSLSGGGFGNEHVEVPHHGGEPYLHDLKVTSADVTLSAQYGIFRHLSAELLVPFRINRERIVFRTLDGGAFTPDPPDYHHANRTLTGLADVWLLAHAGTASGAWAFSGRAGASLPTGSTVEDPFALGELGLPHEHIQFGSGTVQPIVGAAVGRAFEGFTLTASSLFRFGVSTNEHGYRPGDQSLVFLYGTSALGTTGWDFSLGPTLYHESTETWGGETQYEGNLGRTDVYADGRVRVALAPATRLAGELRVPVWGEANGPQFDVPVSFRLTISHALSTGGHE
ncbi:MAG: hypothetical protein ACREOU_05610 [Candidatus Eiseniibacteriota bacterium]